jgi:hypothetical protein
MRCCAGLLTRLPLVMLEASCLKPSDRPPSACLVSGLKLLVQRPCPAAATLCQSARRHALSLLNCERAALDRDAALGVGARGRLERGGAASMGRLRTIDGCQSSSISFRLSSWRMVFPRWWMRFPRTPNELVGSRGLTNRVTSHGASCQWTGTLPLGLWDFAI